MYIRSDCCHLSDVILFHFLSGVVGFSSSLRVFQSLFKDWGDYSLTHSGQVLIDTISTISPWIKREACWIGSGKRMMGRACLIKWLRNKDGG